MAHGQEHLNLLDDLTDKQLQVLDLLMLHKTSKQIARELGISPHTVDQRIAAARRKFDVETRNELAVAYMAAKAAAAGGETYESPVYQLPQVENPAETPENDSGSGAVPDEGDEQQAGSDEPAESPQPEVYYRVVPESFEGRYGFFWRLTAIVGITLGLLIATLVGLAIFGELTELLR